MGMYDSISWGDNLPYSPEMQKIGLDKRDWVFQTKDLDCTLTNYIVQDGKLCEQKFKHNEWIEGDPAAKSFIDRLGRVSRREPYLEPVKITATVRMYDYRYGVLDQWDCKVEYEVIFVDGKVKSVKLVKFKKESDIDRKAHERRWREERAREAARWINRFFFYTLPYRVIARHLRAALYKLSGIFNKIAQKL